MGLLAPRNWACSNRTTGLLLPSMWPHCARANGSLPPHSVWLASCSPVCPLGCSEGPRAIHRCTVKVSVARAAQSCGTAQRPRHAAPRHCVLRLAAGECCNRAAWPADPDHGALQTQVPETAAPERRWPLHATTWPCCYQVPGPASPEYMGLVPPSN